MELAGGTRAVGELVPEAASWPNLRVWINQGHIAQVADHEVSKFVAALRVQGCPDATKFAPGNKPQHLASAARKLQLDAAAGSGSSPLSGPGEASAASPEDGNEEAPATEPTTAAPKPSKPQRKRR